MQTRPARATALRAVEAYGGAERWGAAETVHATCDCGGLIVRWKRRVSGYHGIGVKASVREPRMRMAPFGAQRAVALLSGHDVRLERPDGTPIAARSRARDPFPYGGRRAFAWDELDFAYFIGYALWNYLVFPALLLREDIEWRAIRHNGLESRFPAYLPTHARVQQFYFDETTGLLAEYDYVAEVCGRWANAAHRVTEHGEAEGVPWGAKRRVTPQVPKAGPGALRGPLMMWADLRDYKLS